MHKRLEPDHNAVDVGNLVLAIDSLTELLLSPVLKIEDAELPQRAADRSRDATERGSFKVVLYFAEPRLVLTAGEVHRHLDRNNGW